MKRFKQKNNDDYSQHGIYVRGILLYTLYITLYSARCWQMVCYTRGILCLVIFGDCVLKLKYVLCPSIKGSSPFTVAGHVSTINCGVHER